MFFKVVLILTGAKFHKRNQYLNSIMSLSTIKFWRIKILLTCKILERYFKTKYITCSIYYVLALSHQCECVSTKITSITEECLSRNRRIKNFTSRKHSNTDNIGHMMKITLTNYWHGGSRRQHHQSGSLGYCLRHEGCWVQSSCRSRWWGWGFALLRHRRWWRSTLWGWGILRNIWSNFLLLLILP